jgi:hypothetical protein
VKLSELSFVLFCVDPTNLSALVTLDIGPLTDYTEEDAHGIQFLCPVCFGSSEQHHVTVLFDTAPQGALPEIKGRWRLDVQAGDISIEPNIQVVHACRAVLRVADGDVTAV